jgi:hypothetical protein
VWSNKSTRKKYLDESIQWLIVHLPYSSIVHQKVMSTGYQKESTPGKQPTPKTAFLQSFFFFFWKEFSPITKIRFNASSFCVRLMGDGQIVGIVDSLLHTCNIGDWKASHQNEFIHLWTENYEKNLLWKGGKYPLVRLAWCVLHFQSTS